MSRNGVLLTIGSGILLFLSIGVALGGTDSPPQPINLPVAVNCDPVATACSAGNDDITLSLHLAGEVHPLKPFTVELDLRGRAAATVNKVTVGFAMVGMEMGENAFKLVRGADGVWQGQAMLPICSHGRRDWRVTVEAAGEALYTAPFNLQVGPGSEPAGNGL